MSAVSSAAKANASSVPMRSPQRPMSAACTAPPTPPAATRTTANAVTLLRRRGGLVRLEEAERIALGVLAAREPADARDRLLVLGLASELAHLRQVGVDVVAAEVDNRALLAFLLRVDRAAPAVVLEHAVVDPLHAGSFDRPAAQAFPELLAPVGVLRRELDVHDLLAHLASFLRDAIRSRPWSEHLFSTRGRRRIPSGTGSTSPTSSPRCRARPSGTAGCSAQRSESRGFATTPSSSGRTYSRSRKAHAATPSPLPAKTQWQWASPSPCISRRLTESNPTPRSPAELGFETIVYEKAPPRATITLNRPNVLNAFDFRMLRELARACEDVSWDDEIRVLVVTGAGRAFCVGADLRSWGEDLLGNSKEYWKL